MGYWEGKQKIISYVTDKGRIIELDRDKRNAKQHYKEIETFSNGSKIAIRYPGYKTTREKCDYCVLLVDKMGEHSIAHREIMQDLYEKTNAKNYGLMKRYIEAVAEFGMDIVVPEPLTNSCCSGFSFEELTALMFYIAIQEDINYPKAQGRKMCFNRYWEAIYCKVYNNHVLWEALDRAAARYIPKNWNDAGDLYDVVFRIRR